MAGELGVRHLEDRLSETVARHPQSFDGRCPLGSAQLVGFCESHRARHVLRAGAAMALLLAAVLLGQDVGPVLDVERADALGAFELVAADRDEVDAELAEPEIDIRGGLDRVDVEQDPLSRPNLIGDLGDRLERADLVVREHDRDKDRAVRQRRVELVRIDTPVSIHWQLDDLESELLEVAKGMADRVMLDRRGDDPVAPGLARPGRALQGEVVRLRAARREHDLARFDAEARRQPVMGVIERRASRTTERVRR